MYFTKGESKSALQASKTHDSNVRPLGLGRMHSRAEEPMREVHVRLTSLRHQRATTPTHSSDTRQTSNAAHFQSEHHRHDERTHERGARRFPPLQGRRSRVQAHLHEVQAESRHSRLSTICFCQFAWLLREQASSIIELSLYITNFQTLKIFIHSFLINLSVHI